MSEYMSHSIFGALLLMPCNGKSKVLLVGLEFVDPLFSGNGILTHSVVRALLLIGYDVVVLCARPEGTTHHVRDFKDYLSSGQLTVYSVPVPVANWKRLDRYSAWEALAKKACPMIESHPTLNGTLGTFQYILGVDWSSMPTVAALQQRNLLTGPCTLINLVFRVFSRSRELLTSQEDITFYRERELHAIDVSSTTFVLSHVDQTELVTLCKSRNVSTGISHPIPPFHILMPPLREDMLEITKTLSASSEDAPPRKYLICNVRCSPEKNALMFAHIMTKLSKLGILKKMNLTPLMLGTNCDNTYAAQVQSASPTEMVVIDAFLSPHKVLEYMKEAVLLIHPPVYDAYGMIIAEAAAVGTPSIIHQQYIGASSLFRSDYHEVLTTDMSCVEKAAQCMVDVLSNAALLAKVSTNAKKRALEWTTLDYANKMHQQLEPGTIITIPRD